LVSSKLFGVKEAQKWSKQIVLGIERDIVKELDSRGKKLVKRATTYSAVVNHDTIKNAVKYDVEYKRRQTATLIFFIDENAPNILKDSKRYPEGWNLAWGYNDGTYGNYRRGLNSPSADTVGAVDGIKGLRHTDYFGRSWRLHYPKLIKRLDQIFIRLK